MDVTAGGARYNLSGIQMIQVANLADSLAALKKLVFDEKRITREELLRALEHNFEGDEVLRATLLLSLIHILKRAEEQLNRMGLEVVKKTGAGIYVRGPEPKLRRAMVRVNRMAGPERCV